MAQPRQPPRLVECFRGFCSALYEVGFSPQCSVVNGALRRLKIMWAVRCVVAFGQSKIAVHMLDGTEVDEEAFNCLNQSPEDATYTFIATTYSWVSGVCLDGKLSLPKDVLLLVTFLRSSPKNDAALEWSLKINKAEAEFKDQNAAAVCLLPLLASYFQENLGELFQLHQAAHFSNAAASCLWTMR
ncbi:uncharacterized protein ISCGN_026736 [Ixodes scapularis]